MASARSTRRTTSTAAGTRLLAVAGLVALFGGMAYVVMASTGDGSIEAAPATTAAATPAPKPQPKRPAAARIVVTGVGAFDPEGDRSENDAQAGLATDGNAATAWKSERYRNSFSKSGVGLVLDAGRPVRATSVTLTTETPGYQAEVQVGGSATGPFTTVSASKTAGKRTTFALERRRGRYVVVWITAIPAGTAAAVNEVTVKALS